MLEKFVSKIMMLILVLGLGMGCIKAAEKPEEPEEPQYEEGYWEWCGNNHKYHPCEDNDYSCPVCYQESMADYWRNVQREEGFRNN